MNRRKPITARQLAREKLLFRYSSALERGDFDTLAAILRLAETDPLLEKMLMEMDMVYRAEIAPLPALPTLSAHHNHRHTREEDTMNITYPTITRRLPDFRSRGRWNSAATLAAAMIALVLFAAILIARRPPTDPQQGNPGIAIQNETVTPVPSLTPTPAAAGTLEPYRYTVQEGEDLFSIVLRFGYLDTDLAQTLVLNGLTSEESTHLTPGTVVLLPRIPGYPDFSGCETGEAFLMSPARPFPVSEPGTIFGIATTENFAFYRLEISGPQTNSSFALVKDYDQAVPQQNILGELNSAEYQSGQYQLRLSVFDTANTIQASCTVQIYINTPTPTAPSSVDYPSGTFLPTPVQDGGIISTLCGGVVSNVTALEGTGVFTQPGSGGVLVGYLSETTMVEIMVQEIVSASDYPGLWYYVRTQGVDGWISAQFIIPTSTCPPVNPTNPYDCGTLPATPFPTFTPTWTPTPAAQDATFEPLYATATALVQQVTATALAQTTQLQPTIVPPCIILGPGTFVPPTVVPGTVLPSIPLDRFVYYTVQPGDSIGGFIAGYSIPLEDIAILNPELDFTSCDFTLQDGGASCNVLLTIGQTIKLPIIGIPINATPIAVFDLGLRDGGYVLLTTEQVGDIPANARVRINSAQYNGSEWLYEVIAKDGETRGQAHDWQLQYAPDFTPGAATPTAVFNGALGSGFYAAVTNQAVGNIPAGTRVQIGSAFYNGVEWNYNITDQSGRQNTARESQLDIASDYTPGMATSTAAYFGLNGQVLITLVQVGTIPANTPVQATSGYYNGTEWVYGVMTLDGSAFADIPASQLQAVSLGQAGVEPTLVPTTYPPTFTPTPFS